MILELMVCHMKLMFSRYVTKTGILPIIYFMFMLNYINVEMMVQKVIFASGVGTSPVLGTGARRTVFKCLIRWSLRDRSSSDACFDSLKYWILRCGLTSRIWTRLRNWHSCAAAGLRRTYHTDPTYCAVCFNVVPVLVHRWRPHRTPDTCYAARLSVVPVLVHRWRSHQTPDCCAARLSVVPVLVHR